MIAAFPHPLKRPSQILIVGALVLSLSGCGTFQLGRVQPQQGKTAEQQQLDTLTCKDEARLAASTNAKITEGFLLGLTIVGTPIAYQLDRDTQRDTFAKCMRARGYEILPPEE